MNSFNKPEPDKLYVALSFLMNQNHYIDCIRHTILLPLKKVSGLLNISQQTPLTTYINFNFNYNSL